MDLLPHYSPPFSGRLFAWPPIFILQQAYPCPRLQFLQARCTIQCHYKLWHSQQSLLFRPLACCYEHWSMWGGWGTGGISFHNFIKHAVVEESTSALCNPKKEKKSSTRLKRCWNPSSCHVIHLQWEQALSLYHSTGFFCCALTLLLLPTLLNTCTIPG